MPRDATQSINALLLDKSQQEKKKAGCHFPWRSTQFAKNLLNTFIKTGYTSAFLITDTFALEATIYKMSWWGIGFALPLALFFSICESYAHDKQTGHFEEAEAEREEDDLEAPAPSCNAQAEDITNLQKTLALGHFFSDLFEDMEPPIILAKLLGIDDCSNLTRGLTYLGIGIYSFFGNKKELDNTITAIKGENNQRVISSPSSHSYA